MLLPLETMIFLIPALVRN